MASPTAFLVLGVAALALVPIALMSGLAQFLSSGDLLALMVMEILALVLAVAGTVSLVSWRKRRPARTATAASPQSP